MTDIEDDELGPALDRWYRTVEPVGFDEIQLRRSPTVHRTSRRPLAVAAVTLVLVVGVGLALTSRSGDPDVQVDAAEDPSTTSAPLSPVVGYDLFERFETPVATVGDVSVATIAVPGVGLVDVALPTSTFGAVEAASVWTMVVLGPPAGTQVAIVAGDADEIGWTQCEAGLPSVEAIPVHCEGPEVTEVAPGTSIFLWQRISGITGEGITAPDAIISFSDGAVLGLVYAYPVEKLQEIGRGLVPQYDDGILSVTVDDHELLAPASSTNLRVVGGTGAAEQGLDVRVGLCDDRGPESYNSPDWVCTGSWAVTVYDLEGNYREDLAQLVRVS